MLRVQINIGFSDVPVAAVRTLVLNVRYTCAISPVLPTRFDPFDGIDAVAQGGSARCDAVVAQVDAAARGLTPVRERGFDSFNHVAS